MSRAEGCPEAVEVCYQLRPSAATGTDQVSNPTSSSEKLPARCREALARSPDPRLTEDLGEGCKEQIVLIVFICFGTGVFWKKLEGN